EDVTVTATDKAGNSSPEATVTAPDTTAPDAPTDLEISEDGTELTGKAEPGSTVTVTTPSGEVKVEAGADGNFTVTLDPALTNGEDVTVTATDKAGNSSPEAIVTAPDTTAPDAPTDLEVNNTEDADGNTTTTVTGKGEPGANVIITDKDGTEIGTGTVDGEGNFSVDLDQPLTNGGEIKVSQKDKAGNPSPEAIVTAPDTTAPDAPTDLEFHTRRSSDLNTTTTVTGKGEPGANVIITDKDGTEIGTGTVDGEGNFSVDLDQPLKIGRASCRERVDNAGNAAPEDIETARDRTEPDAPT